MIQISDVKLLNELKSYGISHKAESVYLKCLRYGKTQIANRIKIKYGIRENYDDTILAFGATLINSKK